MEPGLAKEDGEAGARGLTATPEASMAVEEALSDTGRLLQLGDRFGLEVLQSLPANPVVDFAEKVPIGFLRQFLMVPVITQDKSYIAIHDPAHFQALDDLRRLLGLKGSKTVLAPASQITRIINYAYDMTQSSADEVMQDIDDEDPEQLFSEIEEVGDLLDDTSDSPVIRLVNLMFSQAVRDGASDIHIEPYRNSLKIRQRLDGILYDMLSPPRHVQSALVSRIKIMARLDIAEKRLPQDGRIEIRIADNEVDVRVSTLPTAFGERVVLRLLRKSAAILSLTELGMPQKGLDQFERQIQSPNGIVLVTGPTGSGKTTTLYAALSAINSSDINIITVEDPIEYRISGIGQMQVNPKIDLTFASGLRSIVRQDPDVILVGEIRDSETAEIAIQSALTGHLVFSTLHTNDAASAITRLTDMGIEPFLIASSVNAILAQRLVRINCEFCLEEYQPAPELLMGLGIEERLAGEKIMRGRGCERCHHTGFRGRQGIFEMLVMSQELKSLVLTTSDANLIMKHGIENGMLTLLDDGVSKILAGKTTIEELYRVSKA